ncbi:MAG: phosphoribosylamine--glycine ligase [Gammaproteobacteria bacterium]|nr:phosphoribosylamine--glycine ligase [Gammaproteobacteria bacterium]
MNILIIGSGGREHALAWRSALSEAVDRVYVAPGNAGTALASKLENVPVDVMDFQGLAGFAKAQDIGLTIVGPEIPLVEGIVDYFQAQGLRCFGPSRDAAQLEGSKTFTKEFLQRHKIPTAAYGSFSSYDEAADFICKMATPIVIKADGLAAGKGVVIAETVGEALETSKDMLSGNAFGAAGHRVVIEEYLVGEEASFIVLAQGKTYLPFASSQDHKAAGDGDKGPNTGGMGAYSPAPVITPEIHQRILTEVIEPTLAGMFAEGNSYTGFLYAGLMIEPDGTPRVIEYNCRFGDPETQPIMLRMESDLVALCNAALDGSLSGMEIKFSDQTALTVVLAAGGYPLGYRKGDEIAGLKQQPEPGTMVFHAGTSVRDGSIVTNGGRVLGVTALGDTVAQARTRAYDIVASIDWPDMYHRSDIGYRAVAREESAEH